MIARSAHDANVLLLSARAPAAMEDALLRPPHVEHAPTPPPPAADEASPPSLAARPHIKWDLRHPYDRLRARPASPAGSSASRDTSPFGSAAAAGGHTAAAAKPDRPKLTIVTSTPATPPKGDCIVEVASLPSGSSSTTATNSGTPPSTTLSSTARSGLGKPRRPPLARDNSTASSIASSSSTVASASTPRTQRWFGFLTRRAARPAQPIPSSPHTPLHLPRRLSRLPSFFTRERLYLPTHIQRRDVVLLCLSALLALAFTALGIFAAVQPQTVCNSKFLQSCVDTLLPGLFIGAPYTVFVVAVAVSGWGKNWIRGRYTPLLYVLAATLGKVGLGALIANLDWTVLAC